MPSKKSIELQNCRIAEFLSCYRQTAKVIVAVGVSLFGLDSWVFELFIQPSSLDSLLAKWRLNKNFKYYGKTTALSGKKESKKEKKLDKSKWNKNVLYYQCMMRILFLPLTIQLFRDGRQEGQCAYIATANSTFLKVLLKPRPERKPQPKPFLKKLKFFCEHEKAREITKLIFAFFL